jgi:hypothetical protein
MVVMLVPLVFALGAVLAAIALVRTWRGYGPAAFANVAALREVRMEREFDVRVGHHPALVGSVVPRRWSPRLPTPRRSPAAAGLRAAA